MSKKKYNLKIGDSVIVKPGTKDPDLGGDLGGWQGRITELDQDEDDPTATIAWDSITLKAMPTPMIAHCEKEGLDWQVMGLDVTDIELASPRDTAKDVEQAANEILNSVAWLHLDEEGERIQTVLDGIDPDDEMALVEAWEEHLEENLSFPFEAEVAEYQERGPLQTGDHVKVKSISEADDHYGVLVEVRRGGEKYVFPLCDLEVIDKQSPNYQPVKDYVVWFANR